MNNEYWEELKTLREKYTRLKLDYDRLLQDKQHFSQKINAIVRQLPFLAIQGYNTKREIIFWNDFSSKLYGFTPDEAQGQQLEDLIIPDAMREKVIIDITNMVNKGIPISPQELILQHKDGSPVPVFSQHVIIELPGNEKEVYCLDIDLSELKEKDELLQEAKRLAITDGLTNLYNRLFYMQMADLEIKQAKRDRKYLVFAMYDMDNFKKYNDAYGHRQGDELLKAFADILIKLCCRPNDYPFRIGGEEFLIIYSAESRSRAHELGKRVVDSFACMNIPHDDNSEHDKATLSAGIAVVAPESELNADELYHHADTDLYAAKENGRNTYIISYH